MSSGSQNSIFTEKPELFFSSENKVSFLPKFHKQIPVKIIVSDDTELNSLLEDKEKNSTKTNDTQKDSEKTIYPFYIIKSRKKDKKILRKKITNVVSRAHNIDCLMKKIKA